MDRKTVNSWIAVNEPVIGEEEISNVLDCLKTGWISSAGKYIETFENLWAQACGVQHGIAVSNGTVALELAIQALDLKPGDEVIMPTFTIISCAIAVVAIGAIPVLVDCDPVTGCMDVNQIKDRITSRTRAIMPVHIYGHPVDMDPVIAMAHEHGLIVIEDAAEVHSAEYLSKRGTSSQVWRPCGGIGDLATFSFFANKLITTGEGGMVVTNNSVLAEKMRGLRNLCFRSDRRFYHTDLGHNYRFTNLQAALGVAQVARLPQIISRKREIAERYTLRLAKLAGLELPKEKSWARSVYWVYGLLLDDQLGFDAVEMSKRLKSKGVETRPYFLGMHEQPALHERGLFISERYPVAERWARRGFYIPAGLAITNSQIDQVCEAIAVSLCES